MKVGIKVIVALPNSRIAGNVKIKKGKMRGQVSNGMICSLQEIGYSDSVIPKEYAEGIYYMPQEAVNGDPVFLIWIWMIRLLNYLSHRIVRMHCQCVA